MIKAGIIGSTGYAGQQLTWLLHYHKNVEVDFLSSHNHAGSAYAQVYPNYKGFIQKKCIDISSAEEKLSYIDVLFIALPHGKAFHLAEKAIKLGVKVIDLGADFRLKSSDLFKKWYQLDHPCAYLLQDAVYGLPEIYKEKIKNTSLVANPGCYPTASILGLAPLLKSKLVDFSSIIIDAKSGVSGSGRKANTGSLFAECNESVKAYGLPAHRHTPEIEQELSNLSEEDIKLSFTPHLIPMNRGILATCYANLKENIGEEELYQLYKQFYKDAYFVRVREDIPETRYVRGSNFCDIGIRIDPRTKRVIILSAIDNLVKGAAGQAVQNMNLMFGFNETEGLTLLSMAP